MLCLHAERFQLKSNVFHRRRLCHWAGEAPPSHPRQYWNHYHSGNPGLTRLPRMPPVPVRWTLIGEGRNLSPETAQSITNRRRRRLHG